VGDLPKMRAVQECFSFPAIRWGGLIRRCSAELFRLIDDAQADGGRCDRRQKVNFSKRFTHSPLASQMSGDDDWNHLAVITFALKNRRKADTVAAQRCRHIRQNARHIAGA
jgi:hypothetical protein